MSLPFSWPTTATARPRKRPRPAIDGAVLAKEPVAGQRRELVEQRGDIVGEMRPGRMARDLNLLPRRQLAHRYR